MSMTSHFAFESKTYNEIFAFQSNLWKLQKWLNQFRSKSASPSPSSTISKSSTTISRHKRRQENENNLRSIVEELQSMIASHKRKYKINRVRKKPIKSYALSRALKNIGENLGLSVDDDLEIEQNITKIIFGSKHALSQFLIQIAFDTKTCDVVLDECCFEITLCSKEEVMVDLEFDANDNKSIINDVKHLIDHGNFDKLHNKLLLNKYFDDFYNYFPSLLLSNLREEDKGAQTVHKQIELCLKHLPNIMEYKRFMDGPSVVYAQQIMDCILTKIKPPRLWRLSFVGLFAEKCFWNEMNNRNTVCIKAIINNDNNNKEDGTKDNKQQLLYWFVLNPAIIVPLQVAKDIFKLCVGNKEEITDRQMGNMEDVEKGSAHSSIMDQTYCYHNMLIGDMDLKYRKAIEIFENEYQYFKFKNTDNVGNCNGVRIEQIAIADLNYVNKDEMDKSTLFKVIQQIKNWVIINQLYAQCFHHNDKKWRIKTDKVCNKVCNKFEISVKDANHLEITHIANSSQKDDNSNSNIACMDIDDDDDEHVMQYKLPPKVDGWMAHFCIDIKHNISVSVKYWISKDENSKNQIEIDKMYDTKINEIVQKTNSVPITLSYISKLFDGTYLKDKLKLERIKQYQKQSVDDDTDNMVDID